MITNPLPLTSDEVPPFVTQLAQRLRNNTQGDVWVIKQCARSRSVQGIMDHRQKDALTTLDITSLLKLIDERDPADNQVIQLDDRRRIHLVPVEGDQDSSWLIAVQIHATPAELEAAVLTQTVQSSQHEQTIAQQELHLNDYVNQVSTDFEELSWLRRFSEHLVYQESTSNIAYAVQNTLKPLVALTRSESLVVVSKRDGRAFESLDSVADDLDYVWIGPQIIRNNACRQFVIQHANTIQARPIILNDTAANNPRALPDPVKSCVLASIHKDSELFGAILAFNHSPADYNPIRLDQSCPQEFEREYGTHEASLLEVAASILATHAHNIEMFQQKEEMLIGVIRSLINAVDAKDPYTCGHSDRVALISKALANHLGLPVDECEKIYLGGLLHDIGKIGVPDEILQKPGKLTDDEFDEIKKHPAIGYRILEHLKDFQHVLPGVLHHHESFDGTGYPHGLEGDQIPFVARIMAVADAFDAMTSNRPYRDGMPAEKAENILRSGAGKQWDREVIDAFFQIRDEIHDICHRTEFDTRKLFERPTANAPTSYGCLDDSIMSAVALTTRHAV